MPHPFRLALVLFAAACTHEGAPRDPVEPYTPPEGATVGLYRIDRGFDFFPDLSWAVEQPDAPTHIGLSMGGGFPAWMEDRLPAARYPAIDLLESLDGFSLNGATFLRFSAPVSLQSLWEHTQWTRLDTAEPVAFEASLSDDEQTLFLVPLASLAPNAPYAITIKTGARDRNDQPLYQSSAFHDALTGNSDRTSALVRDGWAYALQQTDQTEDDLVAGLVFHTQSLAWADAEVAAHFEPTPLVRTGACEPHDGYLTCHATLHTADLLGDDGFIAPGEPLEVQRWMEIPVDIHLPGDGTGGPFPVAIFGHGLAGTREEARHFASQIAATGFAVVGIDAPFHGEHPTSDPSLTAIERVLAFFGASANPRSLDSAKARDHWREATWDKVQLANAIELGFDADGDGHNDFQTDALHYAGHSLGAMMGVAFVAMRPDVKSAYLSVPGGGISEIIRTSPMFAPLIPITLPVGVSLDDQRRFFILLQSVFDLADTATWASRLLDGERDLLVQMVMDDQIIPNGPNRFLARSIGLPLVGEVQEPIASLPIDPTPLPLTSNVGEQTTGLMQFAHTIDHGEWHVADHTTIFDSDTNTALLEAWFGALAQGRHAEIGLPPKAGSP